MYISLYKVINVYTVFEPENFLSICQLNGFVIFRCSVELTVLGSFYLLNSCSQGSYCLQQLLWCKSGPGNPKQRAHWSSEDISMSVCLFWDKLRLRGWTGD